MTRRVVMVMAVLSIVVGCGGADAPIEPPSPYTVPPSPFTVPLTSPSDGG